MNIFKDTQKLISLRTVSKIHKDTHHANSTMAKIDLTQLFKLLLLEVDCSTFIGEFSSLSLLRIS